MNLIIVRVICGTASIIYIIPLELIWQMTEVQHVQAWDDVDQYTQFLLISSLASAAVPGDRTYTIKHN